LKQTTKLILTICNVRSIAVMSDVRFEIEKTETGWLLKYGNKKSELEEEKLRENSETTIAEALQKLGLEASSENIAKLKDAIAKFGKQLEETKVEVKIKGKYIIVQFIHDSAEIAKIKIKKTDIEEKEEEAVKDALKKAKVPNFLAYVQKIYYEILKVLQEEKNKRYVVFETLETTDGRILVQEVFDYGAQKFGLLIYNQKTNTYEIVEKYKVAEETWLPQPIPISKLRKLPRVILASEPEEFNDVKSLMEEIKQYLQKYADLKPEDLWFLVRFILHTWLYDVSDYACQVQVLGDFGSGKTRVFKLSRLLCYNALGVAGGSTISAYKRLQSKFAGTFLVNELEQFETSDDANTFVMWVNNGFEKDLPIALSDKLNPEKQRFFDPFGPKLFTSRNAIENVAARSRLVIITMQKSDRKDIPIELPDEAYEEAKTLRNKLLMFRMKYWQPNFKLPQEIYTKLQSDETIEGRFKQIMMPLLVLAAIIGTQEEVDEIFEFYRKASLEFKKQIAMQTTEGVLFNTIIEICNQNEYDKEEFLGFIDEDYKLVAITTNLLQKRLGFSSRTIAKALQRIGFAQERTTKKVIVKFEEKEPITKNKVLRKWVFTTERAWREACTRYYFSDQNNTEQSKNESTRVPSTNIVDIPEILKSNAFISLENKPDEKKSMPLMPDMPDLHTGASNSNSSLERKTDASNNLESKLKEHEEKNVAVYKSGISGISVINQEAKEQPDKNAKICANCKYWSLPPGCEATIGTCTLTGQGTPKGHTCASFEPKEVV